jgi:pimeloyl-ACP methyl ester carboxylesterase
MLHHRIYEHSAGAEWVVLVHGAGGSSSIWYRQVRVFQKHFNVLLVDLRGHGESGLRPTIGSMQYTFDDVSRDVIEVLDHLAIDRAHFVGMSLGSIVIRVIAEIAPERVHTLVMGGAIMRLNVRSRLLVGLGNLFKRILPYLWLYRFFAWIIMPRKRHRKARNLFVREARKLCQGEFRRWFKLTYEINPMLRFFRERELPHPTLYLMGEEDHMFLPSVRAMVAKHRNSVLQVIRGSGHVCNVEKPEAFNRYAIAFMSRQLPAA